MTALSNLDLIEANLLFVMKELENQTEISEFYPKATLSYED